MNFDNSEDALWRSARERLRAAVDAAGSKQEIAIKAGMSPSALSTLLSPKGSIPSATRLGRLAAAAGVSVDYVLTGERPTSETQFLLPVELNVTASAGYGSFVSEEGMSAAVPFPRQWLRREFGDPSNLALIQVKGDSMLPEFADGSWAMFDRSRKGPTVGTYVIRLNGVIQIKDVQFRELDIVTLPRNAGYEGDVISVLEAADPSVFEVLGRVVWSGNMMI